VNSGFLQSAHAVDRPKAPLPTMMTDLGILGDVEADMAQQDSQSKQRQQ
jgi:hypothetical protein